MRKKTIFSGIQPSGNMHVGNYLGAVRQWVQLQEEYECLFCVVDLHSITVPQDPEKLRSHSRELAALLLACGIDEKRSTLFVQSHIPAHSELAWIFNCVAPLGWLKRMTQFKEKSIQQQSSASAGLFVYPALMAADILLYGTDLVPVGEDQKQHIEFTRDLAQKFNVTYGELFKLPEPLIPKLGARIMSLDDPNRKMDKSADNPQRAIYLLDSPDAIRTKISRATTDSHREIRFDPQRPGVNNLLVLYQLFTGRETQEIEERFLGKGYRELKQDLADAVIAGLAPIQEKYRTLTEEPGYLEKILARNAQKVAPVAESVVKEVKRRMGLG
ncbi:MAG: tryptophan--tRNA ligase [Candidatus Omnitrophica bacterium]|nr:tryptophan--tRNA ligase [Candidatus Omnitrophota bacterium]